MKSWQTLCRLPRLLPVAFIRFYQLFLSPFKPACCRFVPTCSEYGRQAFLRHGFLKGFWLTLWRIMRCQPFYHGPVYDPVPDAEDEERSVVSPDPASLTPPSGNNRKHT